MIIATTKILLSAGNQLKVVRSQINKFVDWIDFFDLSKMQIL